MKRLFAIGDIHGCFDSLKELIESNIQLGKNDKLILLGDYIDRGNSWYEDGIENKISKTLSDGTEIFVFTPEYYLAAKIEAHNGRGGNDLRQSHDFEDIVYILDNCSELLES